MTRGRRLLLAIIGPVVLLGSIVLLASGEVFVGILGICFSAAVLAVPIAGRLQSPRPRLEGGTIVLAVSRGRRGVLIAGGVCFAAVSALMLAGGLGRGDAYESVVGGLGTVTFGGFALIGGWALRGPSRLVVAPAGLRWEYGRQGPLVRWDEILGIRALSQRGNRFLCVDVRPGGLPRGPPGHLLARANRGLGGGDINVPVDHIAVDADRAVAALALYAEDPAARAEIGTEASLRRLTA